MVKVKALKSISTTSKVFSVGETFDMDGNKAAFHASKGNVEVIEKELKNEAVKTKELKTVVTTK